MTDTPTKPLSERFATELVRPRNALSDGSILVALVVDNADAILAALRLAESHPSAGAFKLGDFVQKKSGSSWRGKVVGFYATDMTPRGYCVESANEPGSVQIYPETALVEWKPELSNPSAIREAVEGDRSQAAADVLAERQRQVSAEGWTAEHDDRDHDSGQLARAAAAYALHAGSRFAWSADNYQRKELNDCLSPGDDPIWPWSLSWWKPKDPRRDLVRAAALIIAEIERLDRAAAL